MADERRPHFFLKKTSNSIRYQAPKKKIKSVPLPDRDNHAQKLKSAYSQVIIDIQQQRAMNAAIRERGGSYIEFTTSKDSFIPSKFEDNPQGIKLLNVKTVSEDIQKATVYIPEAKDSYYSKKIEEYANHEKDGVNPKNQEKLKSIHEIHISTLEDIWLDEPETMPATEKKWCEIWVDTEIKKKFQPPKDFLRICLDLRIEVSTSKIDFPDRTVYLAYTNRNDLEELINHYGYISELHEFHEVGDYFCEMNPVEQKQWCDDLLKRSSNNKSMARVCVLDTGVAFNHPLLIDVTDEKDFQAVDASWNIIDSNGHGTAMAGICEYFDLTKELLSKETFLRKVKIESVKILPDVGENKKKLYGTITQDAVSYANIANPSKSRVHCLAVTEKIEKSCKGKPSSWSAALDNIISGYSDNQKKLFVVSAGNTKNEQLQEKGYPKATLEMSVQSPAQAWNALTIGAASINSYSRTGLTPLAKSGEICPYSSTSLDWDSSWPVKPDVLFDGGNAVKDEFGGIYQDNTLLTLNNKPTQELFSMINATSAATAQAANTAAELLSIYPEMWPETVRALIIHSARWPKTIYDTFSDQKINKQFLLRTYGYGIASKSRTLNSYSNNAVMIIEDEIQPFIKKIDGSVTANIMNLHELPWPKEYLLNLDAEKVQIKLTLSYFVEAYPDTKSWKEKFKYQSAGLRFDLKKSSETEKEFIQRINNLLREENYTNDNDEKKWILGPQKRNVGSIHSDYWKGTAAELAECSSVAVFPVTGWWKSKTSELKYNKPMRYSLIVSLETQNKEIDIYNAVKTIIDTQVATPVETII